MLPSTASLPRCLRCFGLGCGLKLGAGRSTQVPILAPGTQLLEPLSLRAYISEKLGAGATAGVKSMRSNTGRGIPGIPFSLF